MKFKISVKLDYLGFGECDSCFLFENCCIAEFSGSCMAFHGMVPDIGI